MCRSPSATTTASERPEQARVFLEAIRGHPLETLFTLAVATGMRQGEILGPRWADLDGHRLHIRHTLVRMDGVGGWAIRRRRTPAGPSN